MSDLDKLARDLETLMTDRKMMSAYSRPGRGEVFVLRYLAQREAPALPSELSRALQSSTARISAVLGSLEKKGQILREVDPANRRNTLVTLTPAGRERVERLLEHMRRHLREVLARMGARDAAEYVRLTKLFMDIARHSAAGDGFPGARDPA